jgi:Ca-activated chloride channel family protein
MLLRQSEHKGSSTYEQAISLARRHRGPDEHGYRAEFIRLVELAARASGAEGEARGIGAEKGASGLR